MTYTTLLWKEITEQTNPRKYPKNLKTNERKTLKSQVKFINFLIKLNSLLNKEFREFEWKWTLAPELTALNFNFSNLIFTNTKRRLDATIKDYIFSTLKNIKRIEKLINENKERDLCNISTRLDWLELNIVIFEEIFQTQEKILDKFQNIMSKRWWKNINIWDLQISMNELSEKKSWRIKKENNKQESLTSIEERLSNIEERINLQFKKIEDERKETRLAINALGEIQLLLESFLDDKKIYNEIEEIRTFLGRYRWTYFLESLEKAFKGIYIDWKQDWKVEYEELIELFKKSIYDLINSRRNNDTIVPLHRKLTWKEAIKSIRPFALFVKNIIPHSEASPSS